VRWCADERLHRLRQRIQILRRSAWRQSHLALDSPGITTLVGPNGSGKTTLMNLMTGLVQPSNGSISVMGISPSRSRRVLSQRRLLRAVRFFPRGITGWQFLLDSLMLHGISRNEAIRLTLESLGRVQFGDAADRKIAGYSKGMRQKIRLAQAIAHHPRVLVLDEPLNGLDPMARAESMRSLKNWAGRACISSSPATFSTKWIASPTASS
jgi:ABC-2 type transport system ATP-binding protein